MKGQGMFIVVEISNCYDVLLVLHTIRVILCKIQ